MSDAVNLAEMTERVWATVGEDELLHLTARMVDIPSPTGEEEALARDVVGYMTAEGLEARAQPVAPGQANAIGVRRGRGGGRDLLFYAPLDTAFAGRPDEDEPWIDLAARPDQVAKAVIEGPVVRGLGAHNPKGHGACAVMAAVALARAGIELPGDITVALCAGGMPTDARPGGAGGQNAGHGAGCTYLLEHGCTADAAIVAKPGGVSWEEVGVCWFRVTVRGLLGYAGTRHVMEHRNPIVDAATVIQELEQWFPEYARRNASGLVSPQGSIGAVRAGWPNKPTFIPEVCEIDLDLRASPRTPPLEVRRQFAAAIEEIRGRHPDISVDWQMRLAVPGSHTEPGQPVIASATRGWEFANARTYSAGTGGSGATEANVLRLWGLPTARVGMPPPPAPMRFSGRFSMGEAHNRSLGVLTRTLIFAALDFCLSEQREGREMGGLS